MISIFEYQLYFISHKKYNDEVKNKSPKLIYASVSAW